jgi:hypothetical protein
MTDKEIFYEWVRLNEYDRFDPVDDPSYQKAMMDTVVFQGYLLRRRAGIFWDILRRKFTLK